MADLFKKFTNQEQILKDRDHQLFNFIKQCFTSKTKDGKSSVELEDPVLSVEAALKKKSERKQDILRCGFFTPVAKPYRSLGTVILDNQDLFASYINFEEQQQLKKIMEKKVEEKLIQKIFEEKTEQGKKNQAPSTEQSKLQNGFYHIQKYREENKWISDVMHTGKTLSFCLKELDEKYIDSKKYLESGTLPLIEEKPKAARRYSQRKIFDESVSFSGLEKKAVKRNKECGPLLQIIPKDLEDKDQIKNIYARRREHVIEKLRMIYILLCGVVNMKCKDLKRFVQLPDSYVQFLLKEPQEGENPFPLGLTQLRRIHQQKMTKCYQFMTMEASESRTPELLWKTFSHNENRADNSETCRRPSKALSSAKESLKSELNEMEMSVFELPPWLALIEAKNTTEQRFRQKLKESKDTIETLKVTFANLQKTMAKVTQRRLLLKRDQNVNIDDKQQLPGIFPCKKPRITAYRSQKQHGVAAHILVANWPHLYRRTDKAAVRRWRHWGTSVLRGLEQGACLG
ncbi:uncharacterized protein [Narcine bancroftii]|uniref:uncharacterized protein isoform X2 n=1 Tax=Narcine bancroftii TaxID=1343680 RepID=UPI003832299A